MEQVAVYYLDPIEQVRRKFVLRRTEVDADEWTHYAEFIPGRLTGRVRTVGLWGFREVDLETGQVGTAKVDILAQPQAIKTMRVEVVEDAAPVQGELLGEAA